VPYLRFLDGRRRCFKVLTLGGTVVLNHAQSIDEYPRWFSERAISYAYLSPYHLRSLLAKASGAQPRWPQLKIVLGMAPSSPADRALARQLLTPLIFDTYGTNEIGTVAISTPADQVTHPDSIGRLIDGIAAQVVDGNARPLPAGQVGLIGFAAPHFAGEYLDNPQATVRHFKDGWFYPGDFASMNEEGYIFLAGRVDDVINNSGAKYFPAEVEAVLSTHPAVAEVAVVGGPHPQYGEVSVAYVVPAAAVSPRDLNRFCEGRIAMHKAPQWVFFLAELPRVPPGKPDRKALKAMFRRYLEARPQ
jgi:acyl-coenzyme A synthetase/AMP-(fatty) acid ligase